ncbi:MAG: peptidase S10 [Bdellovibrionota bacterium]
MSEKQETPAETKKETSTKPKGTTTKHEISLKGKKFGFELTADWIEIHDKEVEDARMFYAYYKTTSAVSTPRPLTFCFNGGPGASAVFLHLGHCGPWKVDLENGGYVPKGPLTLIENQSTWLEFTDLVFVDPVGTGFSRPIQDDGKESDKTKKDEKRYYATDKDIQTLCKFVAQFLRVHKRWGSPIYIAGESYGGFRVAKLTRHLQTSAGVNLAGAILVSPAIDFLGLTGSDYNVLHWVDIFPTLVSAALFHGKSKRFKQHDPQSFSSIEEEVEAFANGPLAKFLLLGDRLSEREMVETHQIFADMTGLSLEEVLQQGGRIDHDYFTRALLKHEKKVMAYHDACLTLHDPFYDRSTRQGPDPLLDAQDRAFATCMNLLITEKCNLDTHLEYRLLHMEVFQNWKADDQTHPYLQISNSADELRYGMALNPNMNVMITHGYHDFVTPYHASKRLLHLMKLTPEQKKNVSFKCYQGGHMYYVRDDSHQQAVEDAKSFYQPKNFR